MHGHTYSTRLVKASKGAQITAGALIGRQERNF